MYIERQTRVLYVLKFRRMNNAARRAVTEQSRRTGHGIAMGEAFSKYIEQRRPSLNGDHCFCWYPPYPWLYDKQQDEKEVRNAEMRNGKVKSERQKCYELRS